MKKNLHWALLLALLSPHQSLLAQGVYVTHGPNGPVFSDKPQEGAKEVALPPLNVIAAPKETPKSPATKAPPAAPPLRPDENNLKESAQTPVQMPAYSGLLILSPEDNGSVLANSGEFQVRLAVDPPLQLGAGHAFNVRINGRDIGRSFTSTEISISSAFWGGALPSDNQALQLEVSIVDAKGQILKQAAAVRFYLRHISNLYHPEQAVPLPQPLPNQPIPPTQPVYQAPREPGNVRQNTQHGDYGFTPPSSNLDASHTLKP